MVHGIINVYKEKGFTSHDVVAKLRGIVGQKKIGHTGTLDPDAVGVLPVCLGKGTKLCDMLTDKDKTYETVMLLGVTTDTQDISGEIREEKSPRLLSEAQVKEAVQSFVGEYRQIPPMYSALKVNGRKLYELAREGIEVERKARQVHIYDIRILEINMPRVRMEVKCSKGTYIRTLCHDIGEKLECGACMEELIRTQVGVFSISDSVTLAQISERKVSSSLEEMIVPVDEMFSAYKRAVITKTWEALAFNGNTFGTEALMGHDSYEDQECLRLYDEDGGFIAIYRYEQTEEKFAVVKMFYNGDDR